MSARRVLWHFTCEHGYEGLGERGMLGLNPHPLLPQLGQLAWLTDDPAPARDAVGLTSSLLSCDRMTYRYRVDVTSRCIPWSSVRHLVSLGVLLDLESFGAPETWWISRHPIPVVLDMREEVAA
jgi:hypothetical protein